MTGPSTKAMSTVTTPSLPPKINAIITTNMSKPMRTKRNGIEEAFLKQLEDALEKRELIKIKVLENSGLDAREASNEICEAIGCEGVQAIGSKIVLFKQSKKKPTIELPVAGKK